MNFKEFEREFLNELSRNNKNNCIKLINANKQLIEINLGQNENPKIINKFVKEINNIILKNENKFNLFEKILNHETLSNVNEVFKNSEILVEACKLGNKNMIKWLLNMNVNVCVQDDNGMTALMYVCENPLLTSIIKKLVLDSNCLNLLDKNGENSLFHALCNKDALYELIGTSININQKNNNNDTVLLHCCKNEIYEPIELLTLNNEIDVNITDSENKTAAMYLAEKAKFKELRSLNKRNCNYDFVNKRNESVLSIIIQKMYSSNEEKVCGEFVQYLHILTMLIHFNCSFNLPVDDDENTAIMVFMIVNDMTTLSYVLNYSNNYDLSIKNKFGENASSLAMKLNDNLAIIKKIVNHSTFDINYIDPHNKNTMLMLSVMNKSMFINQFIEDDVNSLNSVNSKDESALIVATKLENEDSVKKLLKYEIININQQDYLGNTALYYAVDLRNFEIIKSMIRGNADMNIKNKIGKSPLDLANEIGDKELLNVLLHPESYSHIEKENPLKSKQTLSNKYQETYEYLYPWIKNHFSEFYND